MNTTSLMIGLVSGAFGCAYFVYGKKQQKVLPLICGIALAIIPYLIDSASISIVVCLALIIIPLVVRLD